MEYLTETVLSGMVYDLIKNGVQISALNLKDKLKRWLISDYDLEVLAKQINEISMLEDLNEAAICRKLQQNPTVQSLIVNVHQQKTVKNIKQKHKGSGDNVGGDKVTNY